MTIHRAKHTRRSRIPGFPAIQGYGRARRSSGEPGDDWSKPAAGAALHGKRNSRRLMSGLRLPRGQSSSVLALTISLACSGGSGGERKGGDGPVAPVMPGSITVVTATSGSDMDPDGYAVAIDGSAPTRIGRDDTVTFTGLSVGSHRVELTEMTLNCATRDANPRTVSVASGDTVSVTFDVACTRVGGRIAFASMLAGDWDIWVMEPDGSGRINLTRHPAVDRKPAWSPDGSRILFHSDRSGNRDVYVMNANGSGVVNLTNHQADDHEAAWSPDGTRIAFISDRDGAGRIYVMNADGSSVARLTKDGISDHWPSWSPDGTRIAYHKFLTNSNPELMVIGADGEGQRKLTMHPFEDFYADWSPDGSRIAWASNRGSGFEIWTMNSDGSDPVAVHRAGGNQLQPSWSPDGAKIVFLQSSQSGTDLFTIFSHGGVVRQITQEGADLSAPDWGPE